jgi:hypothetical protein
MDYWSLKMGDILDNISIFTHLFLSAVDVARVWIAEHDIVTI